MAAPQRSPDPTDPTEALESDVPGRLDRLPWGRFHWLLVSALGITWVLDGLEATVVAAISPMLENPGTLHLNAFELGLAGALYLVGAILGALVFGYLADQLGRKRLFTVTLLIYLAGALLTALAWNFWSFVLFRCVVGLAIGGEYSAINSAIDELVPARLRGRVDLAVNSTYWLGALAGAALSVLLLDPRVLPIWLGWRVTFALGGVIGLGMIIARRFVPESPRWLLSHGRQREAEEIVSRIEESMGGRDHLPPVEKRVTIYPGASVGFGVILRTLVVRYPGRTVLGLVLIASQAFFYNGISFTYPLVLHQYFGVPDDRTGVYVACMAVSNLLGPLLLGHFFDTLGRRTMIAATYAVSGVIILVTEFVFLRGALTALSQTLLWALSFFFASAAASAGYLTVSEIFPLEMRALAIALFYAIGTAIGGAAAPALFGYLIHSGQPHLLFYGYVLGAGLMIAAAVVELVLGIDSEGKALEDVAAPLKSEKPQPRPQPGRQRSASWPSLSFLGGRGRSRGAG